MKSRAQNPSPADADRRRAAKPVIVYPPDTLPRPDMNADTKARETLEKIDEALVLPRTAMTFTVAAGNFFRIVCVDGPQVGD